MAPAAFQPVVQNDAGSLAALAGACSVAEEPTATEADSMFGIRCDRLEIVKGGIDTPVTGEIAGMSFARIDNAFELGVGKNPAGGDALRQVRAITWLRRRDGCHGNGFDQPVGMRFCIGNVDRLQPVGLVDAIRGTGLIFGLSVSQLIGEFDDLIIDR